jgi:hypothetical protein
VAGLSLIGTGSPHPRYQAWLQAIRISYKVSNYNVVTNAQITKFLIAKLLSYKILIPNFPIKMYVSEFQNFQVIKVTTFRRYKFPSYKKLSYKVLSYKIPNGYKALNGYNLEILQHGNFDILTLETNPPIPTLAVSRIPSLYGLLY